MILPTGALVLFEQWRSLSVERDLDGVQHHASAPKSIYLFGLECEDGTLNEA